MAQSVEHLTLDFSSGHDHGIEPRVRLHTWWLKLLSLSLPLSPAHALPLPLKKNFLCVHPLKTKKELSQKGRILANEEGFYHLKL